MVNPSLPNNPTKPCPVNQYNMITEDNIRNFASPPPANYIKVTPQPLVARDLFFSENNLSYSHLESVLPRVYEAEKQPIKRSLTNNVGLEIPHEIMLRRKQEMLKQLELDNILLQEQLNIQALKLPNSAKYTFSSDYNNDKYYSSSQNSSHNNRNMFFEKSKHNFIAASQELPPPSFPNLHNALINEELTRRQHLLEIERDIRILQSIRLEEVMKTASMHKGNQPTVSEIGKLQQNKTPERLTEHEINALKNAEQFRKQKNYVSKKITKEGHSFLSNQPRELKHTTIEQTAQEKRNSNDHLETDCQPNAKKFRSFCCVCDEPSQFICSGCLKSWYCSQTCQVKAIAVI